jgi:hypothetical protein
MKRWRDLSAGVYDDGSKALSARSQEHAPFDIDPAQGTIIRASDNVSRLTRTLDGGRTASRSSETKCSSARSKVHSGPPCG